MSVGIILISYTDAGAECLPDPDWPGKPCLDSGSYSNEELVRMWDGYYEYKGGDWMEMKKAEMDNSISNGSFGEWIDHQTDANSNKNVYEYYRVRGEAPNMVFDSTSGKYIMQNPDSVGVAWYASSTGIAAIVGMSAAVATASFVAFKKSVRK